jgi:hypothetical protein
MTLRWRRQSRANPSLEPPQFPASWENTGNFIRFWRSAAHTVGKQAVESASYEDNSLRSLTGNFLRPCRELNRASREVFPLIRDSGQQGNFSTDQRLPLCSWHFIRELGRELTSWFGGNRSISRLPTAAPSEVASSRGHSVIHRNAKAGGEACSPDRRRIMKQLWHARPLRQSGSRGPNQPQIITRSMGGSTGYLIFAVTGRMRCGASLTHKGVCSHRRE